MSQSNVSQQLILAFVLTQPYSFLLLLALLLLLSLAFTIVLLCPEGSTASHHLQFSMQFVIRTSTCQTICTLHHLQLMLSFIAVKHSHVQQILGNFETTSCDNEGSLLIEDYVGFIRDEGVYSEDEPIDLDTFLLQLQGLIARLRYTNSLMDLEIAWDIVNKNESVCILLGGTSGCGKSTLASLLAHR